MAVPLVSVVLHPRNPRRDATEAVAESLRRFGQRKPIVVQASTRHVVAGNHLVLAARALGWTEIAANVQEMDDGEATAYMLADNRTADLGGYDDTLLAEILAEQSASDNLPATGYTIDDVAEQLRAAGIDDIPGDPDDAPQPPTPRELYVEAGQLWGSDRIDCSSAMPPMRPRSSGSPTIRMWISCGPIRPTGSATWVRLELGSRSPTIHWEPMGPVTC